MIAIRAVETATKPVSVQSHEFHAMGTDFEILLEADLGAKSLASLQMAEAEIRRLDALLTRFRPESELSKLNRHGTLTGSLDLVTVVDLALAGRALTNGRFDPTVHDAIVEAGYDRSFEQLAPDRDEPEPFVAQPCGGGVAVDLERRTIRLDPGVRIDLGGIGKGYAVDRACDILARTGPCLVNAGGDLAVRGSLGGGPWPVGVETPSGTVTLGLEGGAIATSGRDLRRWRKGGEDRHHLIDPSTGSPATSNLLRVTVVAASAVIAEIFAKGLFLAGERLAVREANALEIPCVLVTGDGRAVRAGGLA